MSAHGRGAVATITALLLLALAAGSAAADTWEPDVYPEPSQDVLDASVRTFGPNVVAVEETASEGEERTISLAADVLFAPDSWALSAAAEERIAELVADVPDGAPVAVHGHTDSVVGAVDNQELSENRAEAVAAVIAAARPDLSLDIAGVADTQPVVREDPEDPATRAANRRVEIVYEH